MFIYGRHFFGITVKMGKCWKKAFVSSFFKEHIFDSPPTEPTIWSEISMVLWRFLSDPVNTEVFDKRTSLVEELLSGQIWNNISPT